LKTYVFRPAAVTLSTAVLGSQSIQLINSPLADGGFVPMI